MRLVDACIDSIQIEALHSIANTIECISLNINGSIERKRAWIWYCSSWIADVSACVCVEGGGGIGKASNSYFSYSVWLQSILSIKTSAQKECQRVILYPVNWFSHCCRIISLKFFACFLCNYILSNLLWTRCALYRDCRLLGLHTVYAMHLLPLPLSNCKLKTIYRTRKTRCAFRMMRTFQS